LRLLYGNCALVKNVTRSGEPKSEPNEPNEPNEPFLLSQMVSRFADTV